MKRLFSIDDIKEGKDELILYLINNFGKINKNDLEVALMDLLLKNKFKNANDFEISYKLGIPETKIKRLRYEVDLLNPKGDVYYLEEFYKSIKKSTIKPEGNKLLVYIGDKMLRAYISNKLIDMGSFAEAKYSNILCLTPIDLILLLQLMDNKDDSLDKIIEGLEIHEKTLPKNSKELIKKGLGELTKGFAKKIINEDVVNWVENALKEIDDNDIKKIINYKYQQK